MNSFFRILLIGGLITLTVVVIMLLVAGYRTSTAPDPVQVGVGQGGQSEGQQGTSFISPPPEEIDIISNDFETVLEVDVTREVSFRNLNELVQNPSPVFPTITSEYWMDTKGYVIMTCEYEGEIDTALMMTARYVSEPLSLEDSFRPAREALDEWEPFVLRDIGSLVFPMTRGIEGATPTDFTFIPGTNIKRATFDVNGVEAEIFSGWVLNYLFFSSSALCLEAAKTEIYAPHTH